ncbi:uncharacterized protein LOC129762844 isoform X2 [Toxorhynchites rutilus septentrionalis]|uniref:uncharacterized protein LOC129762844 isoform X2 n=1 Tax=Toxorhynchites rutilus septentrionalis TaxID=329112 RepID=UPI00247A7203|nr:uncharacterized protein LOC129762844 isoform X2 [Toxorhynchites rutilus septentrionalis]
MRISELYCMYIYIFFKYVFGYHHRESSVKVTAERNQNNGNNLKRINFRGRGQRSEEGNTTEMAKHLRVCFVLMIFIANYLTHATIPTIDNIVKVLQSPFLHPVLFSQSLVATDPMMTTEAALTTTSSAPVADRNSKNTEKKSDKDAKTEKDESPTLELVSRVLHTLRSPLPVMHSTLAARTQPGCPLCDSSVYSYCDNKVYHDGCCCGYMNGPGGPGGQGFPGGPNGIGYGGCGYQQDCSFLYANSCYEHQLIVNCCCNSPY